MKPDVPLHAQISWYLLLLQFEGLFVYWRNKFFILSGCGCEKIILIHFLVWSEEVLLIFRELIYINPF